jgi:arylsulfatase A
MSILRRSQRTLMKAVGFGMAAFAVPFRGGVTINPSKRPNLIFIMADDLSARELSCYGHGTHHTPVLDHLAKTGVQFKTCWATPLCLPSRAELMTGRYGFRTGWYHNVLQGDVLVRSHRLFSTLLKEAGYATAICGKWQLKGLASHHGFDEHCLWEGYGSFDGPVEVGTRQAGRAARYWHPAIVKDGEPVPTTDTDYGPDICADFLLDFVRRNKHRPFLVYHPMVLPHRSWDFEAERSGYLPVPEVDRQGRQTGTKVPGSLKSNVEYIDILMRRLVGGLEEAGLRQNTIIFFTSDNGTSHYGKGSTEKEQGLRVPMIVNCPRLVRPSGAVETLIDFSDVLPTLCELAGIKLPAAYVIDGHSFAPVLRGETYKEREWIFSFLLDRRFLRDQRWLLDGDGRFYDCGNRRDEQGYKDVTDSADPEVVAAHQRFQTILHNLPPAPPELAEQARQKKRRLLGGRGVKRNLTGR